MVKHQTKILRPGGERPHLPSSTAREDPCQAESCFEHQRAELQACVGDAARPRPFLCTPPSGSTDSGPAYLLVACSGRPGLRCIPEKQSSRAYPFPAVANPPRLSCAAMLSLRCRCGGILPWQSHLAVPSFMRFRDARFQMLAGVQANYVGN
jgi:hypothetical protein